MFGGLKSSLHVRSAMKDYEKGDYAHAEEQVKRAMAANPGLPEGGLYLGILALKQGRIAEAKGLLEHAFKQEESPTAASALGAAFLLLGEHEAARKHFEAAIKAFPVLFDLRYHIGLSWLLQGERRKALAEFHAMARKEDAPLMERMKRLRGLSGCRR